MSETPNTLPTPAPIRRIPVATQGRTRHGTAHRSRTALSAALRPGADRQPGHGRPLRRSHARGDPRRPVVAGHRRIAAYRALPRLPHRLADDRRAGERRIGGRDGQRARGAGAGLSGAADPEYPRGVASAHGRGVQPRGDRADHADRPCRGRGTDRHRLSRDGRQHPRQGHGHRGRAADRHGYPQHRHRHGAPSPASRERVRRRWNWATRNGRI
jgi:hypothetical protein